MRHSSLITWRNHTRNQVFEDSGKLKLKLPTYLQSHFQDACNSTLPLRHHGAFTDRRICSWADLDGPWLGRF
jgi:hypothetical protein